MLTAFSSVYLYTFCFCASRRTVCALCYNKLTALIKTESQRGSRRSIQPGCAAWTQLEAKLGSDTAREYGTFSAAAGAELKSTLLEIKGAVLGSEQT